ncbi:hypothetical protein KKA33_01280 [Patescibacteria group bacterium]|nr:hypothetical protein [Patescibacteria group bacterium]
MDNDYFKGIYRIETARLKNWDYSSDGAYFITICTKKMMECFGEIRNGIMGLNELSCAAAAFWQEIPQHFAHVILDEWVVMPNHVHGVLIINNTPGKTQNVGTRHVETQNVASLRRKRNKWKPNRFGPQSKNVASIIRGFKIGVTKYANEQKIPFTWQPRFYDRVIRDENELDRICKYIRQNLLKWKWDRNNKNSLI